MTALRAILIDATARQIREVEIDDHDHGSSDMRRLIGCDAFCMAARFDNGDILFVDDAGLIDDVENLFSLEGANQALYAGNGLVVGSDGPETAAAQTPLAFFEGKVSWSKRDERCGDVAEILSRAGQVTSFNSYEDFRRQFRPRPPIKTT